MEDQARIGEPLAMTVNYCSAIEGGNFDLVVRLDRTGRTTQHWSVELTQSKVRTTATLVTGIRRDVWSYRPTESPPIPVSEELSPYPGIEGVAWLTNYDIRFASGAYHPSDPPPEDLMSTHSSFWIGDRRQRRHDFLTLAALSDAFFVRTLQVRGRMVPGGTISATTYFHATSKSMTGIAANYVHGVADANVFKGGISDQQAQLWSSSGDLLTASYQIAFYAE